MDRGFESRRKLFSFSKSRRMILFFSSEMVHLILFVIQPSFTASRGLNNNHSSSYSNNAYRLEIDDTYAVVDDTRRPILLNQDNRSYCKRRILIIVIVIIIFVLILAGVISGTLPLQLKDDTNNTGN